MNALLNAFLHHKLIIISTAGTLTLPVVVYHNVREDYLPLIVQYKVVICSDITRYAYTWYGTLE